MSDHAAFRASLRGEVLEPADPGYHEARKLYNAMIDKKPALIARAADVADVITCVNYARDHGILLAIRGGGHNGPGLGSCNDGLVIDLSRMRGVRVNPSARTVQVAGGAVWGDVDHATHPFGQAVPAGIISTTGVGGLTLGGGIGHLSRKYGLTIDNLLEVDAVLADGSFVTANAEQHPDLFWAVRGGGGGNLGFATRWWLHTVPAENVIAFVANWWSNKNKQDIFKRLVRALEAAPEQMGAQMSVYVTALNSPLPNRISLIGQFRGPLDKFRAIVGSALADAEQKIVLELPYWKAQELFEIEAEPNRYQETSLFADKLSDGLIEEAFSLLQSFPSTVARARLTFFLTGGHVNKTKPDATAFVHRSSQWLINPVVDDWPRGGNVDDDLKWQREVLNRFAEILGSTSSYQNFPDPELADHAEAYWGANLSHLSKVKAAFDPDSVFTPPRNQGIPRPV